MYAHACAGEYRHMQRSEASDSPGAGILGCCEPQHVAAGKTASTIYQWPDASL